MDYIAKIGLEMHCEITNTKSKVFSSAKNSFSELPNSNVNKIDLAYPGVLPLINKKCVEDALMMSLILNCKQPEYMYFERKNYYYPDLPKGYQITQETKPIPVGIYGNVNYECNNEIKNVRINNIHLEEDSASLDHYSDTSNIDYNRAGVPLLELVTEPDFHTADEAVAFLEHMKNIYKYTNISEADTKKGQVRCDVNVSIMDKDLDENDPSKWGTKIEIKNVNSFKGVRDAINYEIKRQISLKENGTYSKMMQETRRWEEESMTTIHMRSKQDAIDYKYFVEPNIPKYKITAELINKIKKQIPKFALERKQNYINNYGLSNYDADVIVKDKDLSDYFEECLNIGINAKLASNWVSTQIQGYINKNNINIKDIYLKPNMLKIILDNLEKNIISTKQAKEIFFKVLEEQKEPNEFINKENVQVSDEEKLKDIIQNILDQNPNLINDYHNGKTNIFDFFVGQVMKETKGKANPNLTKEILTNFLQK